MCTVESGDTSGLFIGTVYVGDIDRSGWHANLFVSNQEVCFKLDSGADANVLPLDTYERLGSVAPLMETNTRFSPRLAMPIFVPRVS